jgi:membrane-bound lytic murein transglycosylase MltF
VQDYKAYALAKVGSQSEFSCLDKLWTKESGWNPKAQNPSSTAYGIAQFLDGTWAGTGIAKTSDPYKQIDAGLIYIKNTYKTPCAAWAHSQSTGWY